jgi:hypothetical protein
MISLTRSRGKHDLAQEASQGITRHNHPAVQSTEDVRRENCKELQGMWTGPGIFCFGSSYCTEKDERECGFAKAINEYEKVQLFSQDNASDIKIVDKAISMID